MSTVEEKQVKIRALHYKDVEDIAEIERLIIGSERKDYWLMRIEVVGERSPMTCLVAEVEGKVVGFIIGEVAGWEYGVPDTVAWIDTLGVHPDYQGKGIATMLFKRLTENLRKIGIKTVYTLVHWKSWDLMRFFAKMGFSKGEMVHLEMKLED